MKSLPFFQVDAFAERPLAGNPAAVMPLDRWLDDEAMQSIAAENNLSETAFTVPSDEDGIHFDLRWFTPKAEVELCGHATLAAAHVLMMEESIRFSTQAGPLEVTREGDELWLDLPAAALTETEDPALCTALGVSPRAVWLASGCNDAAIVELEDENAVRSVVPDFASLAKTGRMAIVTARGNEHDIASRVFVPYLGIDEDPVTGSAHAALVPYWSRRLGRREFTALQASRRGGLIQCREAGERVVLGGRCFTVITGAFEL